MRCLALLFVTLMGFATGAACAQEAFINEIFFNPGGNGMDAQDEYIELRGMPSMALTDHYLIFLESENNGETGVIENIFDLGDFALGSNGFLVLRQAFSLYGSPDPINPDATDLVNMGPPLPGPAFPGFGDGDNSTIGASDLPSMGTPGVDPGEGQLEGSGFTAMLIRNDSGDEPMLGQDLDDGDDGLDVVTGAPGWTILDSVGFITELDELDGRTYAQINFVRIDEFVEPGFVPNIEPGAEFEFVDYEIEYLGRWGNSTGQTAADWHVSNFTDNAGSGSAGRIDMVGTENDIIDWRQSFTGSHPSAPGENNSAQPQLADLLESNKNVPYGTKLSNTLGGPNFITGDYNGDGVVNTADYTVWQDTVGNDVGSQSNHPAADHNHDFDVDADDYDLWIANFGAPLASASGSGLRAVPEPTTAVLLFCVWCSLATAHRYR